ncbi:MAG: polysaccharide deacetylase family protein [Candidatus Competibacteraceae bacterium]
MQLGRLAKYLFCLVIYYSGVFFLVRAIRRARGRRRIVILAYHSFSDHIRYLDMAISPSLFRQQVRYLCKAFKVLTLSDLLATHHSSTGLPGDMAVITVDDGYADNFQPLMEAIEKFNAPATVFLTTDCIDTGCPTTVMWTMLAIHHAAVDAIALPELAIDLVSIRTLPEKEAAIKRINAALKPLSARQRDAIIDRLLERSGAASQVRELSRSSMLSWEQVRRMHKAGVEFGGHTLTHPVLSWLEPIAVRKEIDGSIQRIREMTGTRAVTFAYPYGGDTAVSESVVEICRNSDACAAVLLTEGEMPGSDPFKIPRMLIVGDRATPPWGSFSRAMWACELEGLVAFAWKLVMPIRHYCLRFHSRLAKHPA